MNNVTFRQKILIIILSCILVLVMSYRLLINPYVQELAVLQSEYDTAEMCCQNIAELSGQTAETSDTGFFQDMPSEKISLMISELFENSGIELLSLRIGETAPFSDDISSVYVSEVSVSAKISTSQLMDIIDKINDTGSADVKSFDTKNSLTEIVFNVYTI